MKRKLLLISLWIVLILSGCGTKTQQLDKDEVYSIMKNQNKLEKIFEDHQNLSIKYSDNGLYEYFEPDYLMINISDDNMEVFTKEEHYSLVKKENDIEPNYYMSISSDNNDEKRFLEACDISYINWEVEENIESVINKNTSIELNTVINSDTEDPSNVTYIIGSDDYLIRKIEISNNEEKYYVDFEYDSSNLYEVNANNLDERIHKKEVYLTLINTSTGVAASKGVCNSCLFYLYGTNDNESKYYVDDMCLYEVDLKNELPSILYCKEQDEQTNLKRK